MAVQSDNKGWTLALAAAAIGSGAVGRYLLGHHDDGLVFWALYVVAIAALALPLLLGEAALGKFRRRNIVHALGPGPWGWAGGLFALACIVLAAYLAVVAGWSARMAYGSFGGGFFEDPDRHMRLVLQGWDALLFSLGAVIVAVTTGIAAARAGLRGILSAVALLGLLAAAGLAVYALLETGPAGRDAALAFDLASIDAGTIVEAAQQALIPAFIGLGLVATRSAGVDRSLPREAVTLAILWGLLPLLVGASLAALAHQEGLALDGFGFESVGRIAAAIGGTAGGMVAGTFFGLLLAGSLAALVVVLEVPAAWVRERFDGVGQPRALLGAGLVAYLVAIPMCFSLAFLHRSELVLAALVAPLGGLLMSLHVGWVRPEVLDGFVVGDARHRLERFLRPALRYALPLPLLALTFIGAFEVADAFGAAPPSWLRDVVP